VVEHRRSACPLDCPDVCSLDVTVENDRVVKITGDHRGPITDGFICGKVRKFADHMYGDDRIARPLIRNGARGNFREATWDEALDLVEAKMRDAIARHGAEAILPYHYGGSNGWLTEGALTTRFFRRVGASICDRTFCAAATTAATRGLYGKMPGVALEDYVHSKLIVLWGVNPSATGIHLVPIIDRARAAGAKLVVVDPRRTPLARHADLHLPVRPGADLPVVLSIINALFERGLADEKFLAQHTHRADELKRRASAWTLAAAAREAAIDPALLEQFVELYGTSSPAVVRCGWGVERNRNGGSAVAAVLALPAVAGKFGERGGGFTMSNGDTKWGPVDEHGTAEPLPAGRRVVNMSGISTALRDLSDPPIDVMFIYNCNPVATAPDQKLLLEQLQRDDRLVVVHDQVMTDTARIADVVLPATTFLEHRELRRGYGQMRMFDSPPVVSAFGESRSNNQVFGELLRRFDLVRPGDAMTDDEIVKRIFAATPEGPALAKQIAENGVAIAAIGATPIPFVDVFPGTHDAKIDLVPELLDRAAPEGLYTYQRDPGSQEFPLALISPALATQISSMFGQLRTAPGTLELSKADAAARGISSGDRIRIWNDHGEVHCIAHVGGDVRDGVVVLAKGLWRKHTANGFTSNALIPPRYADLGGQAAFNDARVQVAKL
jgi:anaerobic selenocysteine-containing dehydrogenase